MGLMLPLHCVLNWEVFYIDTYKEKRSCSQAIQIEKLFARGEATEEVTYDALY